jgi:hypothetical protein
MNFSRHYYFRFHYILTRRSIILTNNTFCLKDNGFVAESFNSEMTFVTDETGGLAERPLYLIVIRNEESGATYRLAGVHFYSECLFDINGSGEHIWSDAEGRAKALANKVQLKGVVDMSRWKALDVD